MDPKHDFINLSEEMFVYICTKCTQTFVQCRTVHLKQSYLLFRYDEHLNFQQKKKTLSSIRQIYLTKEKENYSNIFAGGFYYERK